MRRVTYPLLGLLLAATAAQAQDTTGSSAAPGAPGAEAAASAPPSPADSAPPTAEPALPPAPADTPPAEAADPAAPAEPASPAADASAAASAEFTDQEVDQFAQATVKVQAIDADTAIAAEQKQAQMVAAVTEAGLDPATYNKIGRAVAVDPELRTRVQTAMSRHTTTGAAADPSQS